MNFITIDRQHINVNAIVNFYHYDDHLIIFTVFSEQPLCFPDNDRKKYRAICDHIGMNMVELLKEG